MRYVALAMLAGCSADAPVTTAIDAPNATIDSPIVDGPSTAIDAPAGTPFGMTSTAFAEGQPIPLAHACVSKGGTNKSPDLVFVDPPANTMSFVITLTDLTNGLVHAAIYDIPGTATGVPLDVDPVYAPPDVDGAHQAASYTGARGYAGPCPPNQHTYRFTAYALATATLPGATMATTKDTVVTKAIAANIGIATLAGTFTP